MIYQTSTQVLDALAKAQKGQERAQILSIPQNRALVLSIGSNVTLHDGKNALVIHRQKADGTADGLGTLGGLSERTNPLLFHKMSLPERFALLGQKDDVILQKGLPVLIKDLDIISQNNLQRELREELANVGIYDLSLSFENLKKLPTRGLKDDSYLINHWNGQGIAYAINPQCYSLRVDEALLDFIVARSQEGFREDKTEISAIEKLPLEELLTKKDDYHYLHEWASIAFLVAQKNKRALYSQQILPSKNIR